MDNNNNNNFTTPIKNKETPVQKEVFKSAPVPGGEVKKDPINTPPVQTQTPGYEEFTYKPGPRFNTKKVSKVVIAVLTFLIILIPAVFVFLKLNPFKKPVSNKRGEIVWWNLGGNETILKRMIDEYGQKNPGVKITLQVQSEVDYGERLMNSLKDGKGPDVFTIQNSWVPMLMSYLDPIPASVYKEEDYAKDFYPVALKDFKTSAGLAAIPLEYDAITLYVNDDIFALSGKSYPKTWDQFAELAKELTTAGEKNIILQSGASLGLTENVDYWPDIIALMLLQNKSNPYSPDVNGAQSIGALRSYADYFAVAKTWNNTLPASTVAFAEGKTAMYLAPGRAIVDIRKLNPNLKFRTIIVPQVRKDDPSEPDVSYATYHAQAVWKNSNSKDLAWDFLKYLSSDDSYQKISDYSKELGVTLLASSRTSMREKLTNDRYLGSIVALAPVATSWYLGDKTYDGAKGINSVVNAAYKKTVDQLSKTVTKKDQSPLLKPLSIEIKKALLGYGIIR